MCTLKSKGQLIYPIYSLFFSLLMGLSVPTWAQTQEENVEAATNPAGQVADEIPEDAQHLYEQYNQQVMPNFEFLSRGEILNILAYIKVESSSNTAGVSSVSETKSNITEDAPSDEAIANPVPGPDGGGTSITTIVLVGAVLLLLLVVIVLATRGRTKTNV